jgi:hypothetical protein
MGYASILLDKFIQVVKQEKENGTDEQKCITTKIVLNSVDTAVTFYESYGFKWMYKNVESYAKLLSYEKTDQEKENFIMELLVE